MTTIMDEQVEAALREYLVTPGRYGFSPHYMARMRAALEAAERAAWQPIESAPKDGTPVLLGSKRGDLWPMRVRAWSKLYDGWRGGGTSCEATHWRPLPAPPAKGDE
jgi:hypothetical protein